MYNYPMLLNPMMFPGSFVPLLLVLALWTIFWKGLALWHSAQRGEQWWFIALLLLNTAGILEIIYIFLIAKIKFDQLFESKV